MAWQPEAGPLSQLAQVLCNSLSGHNVQTQRQAEQMIEQAKQSPDFINYLAYLTVQPSAETGLDAAGHTAARSAAAVLLKNQIKNNYSQIPAGSLDYVRSTITTGLADRTPMLRGYAGNAINELVKQGGVMSWPQLLPDLVALVQDSSAGVQGQDGALGAIEKICEDNHKALDREYQSQRPLAYLLPKLLDFMTLEAPQLRQRAVAAVNNFLEEPVTHTVKQNIQIILPRLVSLTSDSSAEVRRYVCRAFALLADGLPAVLLPQIQGIVRYTLTQQRVQNNSDLALDAAEFFFEASSKTELRDSLGPYLAEIVPVLLDCMVFDEDDQQRLAGDDDDADEEDDAQDIKPQFATSKRSAPDNDGRGQPANGYAYADDLSDGEIADDDDDEYGDPEDEWNLRKCSAAALDSLALHFGAPVFDQTLPWLMANLQHTDWPNREAAVLAIGAIGPGAIDVIKAHLPQLIPYIITQLSDEQPVVRQISCWALSRFAGWAAELDAAGKQQFFEPMMDGILQRMLDKNKKVQESAASAFATVEEAATDKLVPYCLVIVQQFVQCFEKYKDRNMFILYDCVQTLAEHAGPTLAQPEMVQLLMPALIARWQKVQDASREMFPLLECLSFVATALGPEFSPFAKPFFDRCIRIMQQNLEESLSDSYDAPDKDFLVTSLDLLSAIIQALQEQESAALVDSATCNMFSLLAYCMRDENNDVKQSAYALLGDCAIYIFPKLQEYLPQIMELVINQLDLAQLGSDTETGFRVINNACWSCGEIAMRAGKDAMTPFVGQLLEKLATILFTPSVPHSLAENAAIAIGRIGQHSAEQLAPHLATFAPSFLASMRRVDWTDEKGHAYKGFANIVLANPAGLEKCLLDFFIEMASAPPEFLAGMQDEGPLHGFEMVLRTYKSMMGDFDAYIKNLPPYAQQSLRHLYAF